MTTAQTPEIPRPEYPRPSFVRAQWLNLNGTWAFEFDPGDSGFERGLVTSELSGEIRVPFTPESELSGIGDVDFHEAVWYRRIVDVPAAWSGQRGAPAPAGLSTTTRRCGWTAWRSPGTAAD